MPPDKKMIYPRGHNAIYVFTIHEYNIVMLCTAETQGLGGHYVLMIIALQTAITVQSNQYLKLEHADINII